MIVLLKDVFFIDIMFDEFSLFVSEEQGQKIDGIGEWMKNNNVSIWIIVFSDNLIDKKVDQELCKCCLEVIWKILIEKYYIFFECILELILEVMGYENKMGCNVMIVYIFENK